MKDLQVEKISLDEVIALTIDQVKARYNLGSNGAVEISEKAGATIYLGARKRLYSREKLDNYFKELVE